MLSLKIDLCSWKYSRIENIYFISFQCWLSYVIRCPKIFFFTSDYSIKNKEVLLHFQESRASWNSLCCRIKGLKAQIYMFENNGILFVSFCFIKSHTPPHIHAHLHPNENPSFEGGRRLSRAIVFQISHCLQYDWGLSCPCLLFLNLQLQSMGIVEETSWWWHLYVRIICSLGWYFKLS